MDKYKHSIRTIWFPLILFIASMLLIGKVSKAIGEFIHDYNYLVLLIILIAAWLSSKKDKKRNDKIELEDSKGDLLFELNKSLMIGNSIENYEFKLELSDNNYDRTIADFCDCYWLKTSDGLISIFKDQYEGKIKMIFNADVLTCYKFIFNDDKYDAILSAFNKRFPEGMSFSEYAFQRTTKHFKYGDNILVELRLALSNKAVVSVYSTSFYERERAKVAEIRKIKSSLKQT